jgi:hypothetical protein
VISGASEVCLWCCRSKLARLGRRAAVALRKAGCRNRGRLAGGEAQRAAGSRPSSSQVGVRTFALLGRLPPMLRALDRDGPWLSDPVTG